ncbi:MAG TPA: 6,7-dimethyl-8-ribityllumazine synthase [Gemmatimonadaceae bacterium]|nr:6,7-dimethyl-8-ribityllumazine synthase [Gemmatimonadaceae bacterium]
MPEFTAEPNGAGRAIAVVASRFNEPIVQKLVDGALQALLAHGASLDDVDVVWVPGAWELPVAARYLLESERYDAIIALGAVIRGETAHFDFIAGECARGLQQLAVEFAVPVSFGVLTTEDGAQAAARAGGAHGNKGEDAALAALEMADLFDRLELARNAADGDQTS